MKYIDKTTGRRVVLKESSTVFLAIARAGDAEAASKLFYQKAFSVQASTNVDGVYILHIKPEMEGLQEGSNVLEQLQSDPLIVAVVPALTDADGKYQYIIPDVVIVQLKKTDNRGVASFLKTIGSEILRKYRSPGLFELKVPTGLNVEQFIEILNKNDDVLLAEPKYYAFDDQEITVQTTVRGTTSKIPSPDPQASDAHQLTWNLEKVSVRPAWEIAKGREDIVVAVVDGVPDTSHPALANKFLIPISDDFTFSEDVAVSSHATNICSIVAAESDVLSGIAPGVKLLPVIVNLYSQTYAERADAIRKIAEVARTKKVQSLTISRLVMVCSWKMASDIAVVRYAMKEAIESGVVIVCSAGNNNEDLPHYPSAYSRETGSLGEGIISVAATTKDDRKSSYSNFSTTIDISAPGGDGLPLDEDDILCADQNNQLVYTAGTSMAAPHVAATVGLMLSLNAKLLPKEIKQLLSQSADDISLHNPGYENMLGSGRLNVQKALNALKEQMPDQAPSNEVTQCLAKCSADLRRKTGWSLVLAHIQKDSFSSAIEIH